MVGERLSGLDVAFLHLDDSTAPMNVGSLAIFKPPHPVRVEYLVRLLTERIAQVPRFRQYVNSSKISLDAPEWVDDPHFQVEAHIRVCCLENGTLDQLTEYVAQAMARRIDPTRPLWEAHVVTGLSDGRFVFFLKMHHALSDGMGVIRLISPLIDGAAPPAGTAAAVPTTPRLSTREVWRSLARPDQWLSTLITSAPQVAARLSDNTYQATRTLSIAASVLRTVRFRPASPLVKTSRTPPRRRLTIVQLDEQAVRRIGTRHRAMTHDVVLAVLTGALREWIGIRGHQLHGVSLRALIPVALRRETFAPGQGNGLSGYLCELPVSEPDPAHRLWAIRADMERNKAGGPYRGAGALPLLANSLPAAMNRFAAPLAGRGAGFLFDLVVTTVTMPNVTPRMAGAPMMESYGIVPLAKGHGLSVAVSSYRHRGSIGISLYSDPAIVPDVARIADALPRALTALDPAPFAAPSPRADSSADTPTRNGRGNTSVAEDSDVVGEHI